LFVLSVVRFVLLEDAQPPKKIAAMTTHVVKAHALCKTAGRENASHPKMALVLDPTMG
jgi:hypothetical protein